MHGSNEIDQLPRDRESIIKFNSIVFEGPPGTESAAAGPAEPPSAGVMLRAGYRGPGQADRIPDITTNAISVVVSGG